ncbi:MAG: septum formation initiator family protein [Candidatus Polarisedimenticolia bacterium]
MTAGAAHPGKGRRAGVWFARGFLFCFSAALWVFAFSAKGGVRDLRDLQRQRDALRAQVADEAAQNEKLRGVVEGLRSDDLAIEQAVRAELDYQRPGEVVLMVEGDDPLRSTPRPKISRVVAPPLPKEIVDRISRRTAARAKAQADAERARQKAEAAAEKMKIVSGKAEGATTSAAPVKRSAPASSRSN